jgi:L-asparaginase II
MTWTPLIHTERAGVTECVHFGAIAVADTQGRVLASAGNAQWLTFTRSTLKPFQALPFLQGGGAEHFGLDDAQLALLCASHNGEAAHVRQVERLLAAAGQTYKRLQCGCHVPYFKELGVAGPEGPYDERHHNCSGKHAGFLACCVLHGWPLDTYLEPAHPLQQAIRRDVAQALGVAMDDLVMGTDGCSAPNYAVPLARLAQGFARLASGGQDAQFGANFGPLSRAMRAHPELGSGTGRNDAAFMRAGRGDWVCKVGADGVQAIGSQSRGQALAIKVADGAKPALFAASVEALDQLGWLDDAQREELAPWRAADIFSVKGVQVGARRAVFRLQPGVAG